MYNSSINHCTKVEQTKTRKTHDRDSFPLSLSVSFVGTLCAEFLLVSRSRILSYQWDMVHSDYYKKIFKKLSKLSRVMIAVRFVSVIRLITYSLKCIETFILLIFPRNYRKLFSFFKNE